MSALGIWVFGFYYCCLVFSVWHCCSLSCWCMSLLLCELACVLVVSSGSGEYSGLNLGNWRQMLVYIGFCYVCHLFFYAVILSTYLFSVMYISLTNLLSPPQVTSGTTRSCPARRPPRRARAAAPRGPPRAPLPQEGLPRDRQAGGPRPTSRLVLRRKIFAAGFLRRSRRTPPRTRLRRAIPRGRSARQEAMEAT